MELPAQTEFFPLIPHVGSEFILMFAKALVLVQPLKSENEYVYVVAGPV